ncbi:unnamed protein product [Ectocarpus sp. 13 AM-2016]
MCDNEEVWQVAGHRRRRRLHGGSKAEQRQPQPEMRRIATRGTGLAASDSTEASNGKSKAKSKAAPYKYSYGERNSNKEQSPLEQTAEELVQAELAKLEQLKVLLPETTLWRRLVEGLRHILPQLGIAAPTPAGSSPTPRGPPAHIPAMSSYPKNSDDDNDSTSSVPAPRRRRGLRELVCYGIGNFSENHSSRYQLALALCLRDLLVGTIDDTGATDEAEAAAATTATAAATVTTPQSLVGLDSNASNSERTQQQLCHDGTASLPKPTTAAAELECPLPKPTPTDGGSRGPPAAASKSPSRHANRSPQESNPTGVAMLVFDPTMGEAEKAILAALGCGLLENEEGKRCCCRCCGERGSGDKAGGEDVATPTLFFMPHCPQRLYSNVLWANWSSRAMGSILILGNKISSYTDRLLDARSRADPTNALLRAGPLLQDIDLLPYPGSDRAGWRRDVEKLPRFERAFNDLALSFSSPDARSSAEGVKALLERPQEFVEEEDGELVTGRARGGR